MNIEFVEVIFLEILYIYMYMGFLGGSVGKEFACSAEDAEM